MSAGSLSSTAGTCDMLAAGWWLDAVAGRAASLPDGNGMPGHRQALCAWMSNAWRHRSGGDALDLPPGGDSLSASNRSAGRAINDVLAAAWRNVGQPVLLRRRAGRCQWLAKGAVLRKRASGYHLIRGRSPQAAMSG